jgi:hypothetical protein
MTASCDQSSGNEPGTLLEESEYASINRKELQMRSSAMTRRFRALSFMTLAGASVLVFHSAAFAQQAEPAAKDAEAAKPEPAGEGGAKQQPPQDLPPEYGPPPGYRHGPPAPPPPPSSYPPPGYGPYYQDYYGGYPPPPPRYYRPRYYQPAPPMRYYPEAATYRPFFFGFGLGVGGVGIIIHDPLPGQSDNASRAGLGYNLRLGFGVSPRWSIVLSADGAQAYFDGASVSETTWTIGPQVFITRQLYARAGIGAATYEQDSWDSSGYYYGSMSDSGTAAVAAIGFEFMQHYHTALALEASGTIGYFPDKDKVSTFGLNFVLNLF